MNSVSTKPSVLSSPFGGIHGISGNNNNNISAAFLATGLFIASAAGAATGVGVATLCKTKKTRRHQNSTTFSTFTGRDPNRNGYDSGESFDADKFAFAHRSALSA